MNKKSKAVVVVPLYNEIIDELEKISIDRLFRVLGRYEIRFACPYYLAPYLESKPGLNAVYFDNIHFQSITEYSKLMLSEEFYSRFIEFEYLLLYQTDAYVFRDDLQYYIEMGYDYYGAPVPHYIWTDLWSITGKKVMVGNGGFSLRKIRKCLDVIRKKNEIFEKTGTKDYFEKNEDVFWSYCTLDDDIDFSAPTPEIAMKFSIDIDLENVLNGLPCDLPFGCHRWNKCNNLGMWRPYIEEIISDRSDRTLYEAAMKKCKYMYVCKRLSSVKFGMVERVCKTINSEKVNVWGYGERGRLLVKFLELYDFEYDIFDTNIYGKVVDNKLIKNPAELKTEYKSPLIVITPAEIDSIEKRLRDWGKRHGKDYVFLEEFEIGYVSGITGKTFDELFDIVW